VSVRHDARVLERLFAGAFAATHDTVLVGGAEEPLYLPATTTAPAEIRYRADYFASALHEVAHWCVAGAARRRRVDYGYWYAEAGRDAAAQAAFERVEVRPQAIESLFAAAAGSPFRISLDNPGRDEFDPAPFAEAVAVEAARLHEQGLPPRAARFRDALAAHFAARRDAA
jgi:elongation factor P hydroxylase